LLNKNSLILKELLTEELSEALFYKITNHKSQIPNPPTGKQANYKHQITNSKRLGFVILSHFQTCAKLIICL